MNPDTNMHRKIQSELFTFTTFGCLTSQKPLNSAPSVGFTRRLFQASNCSVQSKVMTKKKLKSLIIKRKYVYFSDLEDELDNPAIVAEYEENVGEWVDASLILTPAKLT
jgi:hypothetical protein